MEELRKREDLPHEELVRREYQALPLLGSLYTGGLAIHVYMAESPSFFVDVVCDAFLPVHRDKSQDAVPPTEEQARA
jgi:hypothetical protein